MSDFWSLWIILLTTVSIVLMTWILFGNRTRSQDSAEGANERTTGHNYDGIEEYDNPLPAWWFYMFVITIVWGVGYLVVYPGMGKFEGLLGWTQIKQYESRVASAEEKYGAVRQQYLSQPIAEIASDPALRRMGMRMFGNNCAQCHGADARGSYGFPNLTDDDWIYGDTPDAIKTSIAQGRRAAMPAWGDIIGEEGVTDVTNYLLALNEGPVENSAHESGKKVFATYCVACHGADAAGNKALGAPNLSNGIWLYGGTEDAISHSIRAGRQGVMPAHADILSEDKIHILSAYVYGLRN